MSRTRFHSFLLLLSFWACFCLASLPVFAGEGLQPVKYVFLFIGDGMALSQRMLTEEYRQKTEQRGLRINAMERQGLMTTFSANAFITDSAASGTALACGEKTDNGKLGVAPDGRHLESIAVVAQKSGRKVGIITSVTINHATPGAFYAHNASRGNSYEIGLDLIASGFDYFGGGGIDKPNDEKSKAYRGDLYEAAKEAGYTVSRLAEEFRKLKPGAGKVLSFGAKGALPYAIDWKNAPAGDADGDTDVLRLADFTRQGIELLDNPKGFFMMVEGGAIDWACHANDAATMIGETLEFDDAVGVALDFAEKHPEDTLIVVTADHETGGLALGCSGVSSVYADFLAKQKGSIGTLGAAIKKFGKENEVRTFDEIKPFLTEKTGLIFATEEELEAEKKGEKEKARKKGGLNLSASEEKELESVFKKSLEKEKLAHGSNLAKSLVRLLNAKSGAGWTTGSHTGLPVVTTAQGPGSEQFAKPHDNTDIAKKLKTAVR